MSKKHLTWQEKKRQKELNNELDSHGLALSVIEIPTNDAATDRIFVCLVRGLLIFMASCGTIGGIVSSFNLPFMPFFVLPCLLFISMLIALLYYNRACFYIGYILFFAAFVFLTISRYLYINSGFQAFMNVLYEKYSDYFKLSTLREGTEIIANRTVTVSYAMIFMGIVMAVLLNIAISGYMSLFWTFLLTFPLLQVALYIDIKPALPYMILLIASYISVTILRRSSHYRMPTIKNMNDHFISIRRRNKREHMYLASGRGMIITILLSTAFATLFLVLCLSTFYNNFNSKDTTNKLKNTTDQYVKMLVQNGLLSLFDRYESVGGISNGRIGGVSSVRPDYETDLIIHYVPINADTVYLKAYVGNRYNMNEFEDDDNLQTFSSEFRQSNTLAKMQIKNVGADKHYQYKPYDTLATKSATVLLKPSAVNRSIPDYLYDPDYAESDAISSISYEAIYDPFVYARSYPASPYVTPEIDARIHAEYLSYPDYLKDSLKEISDDAGLKKYSKGIRNVESYEEKQQLILVLADKLDRYYFDNYKYSMSPGTTPYGKDTIEYFLTKQKRGYCVHFASSAVMLLRYLGIPARYVEGYVIQSTDLNDASGVTNDTSTWMTNTDIVRFDEAGVVEVNITDGNAHAWVELYIDGYGWIPYEFTPPSTDDDEIMRDFRLSGLFSALLSTGTGNTSESIKETGNVGDFNNYRFDMNVSFGFLIKPLITLIIILIVCILLFLFLGPIIDRLLIWWYCKHNHYSKAITIHYRTMRRIAFKRKVITAKHPLIRDIWNVLPGDTMLLTEYTQQAFFSDTEVTDTEYSEYMKQINSIKEQLKNKYE